MIVPVEPLRISVRVALLVVIGIAAWIWQAGIGGKPITYDETFTALRVSGYTKREAAAELGSDRHQFADLRRYQCGNELSSDVRTAHSLAADSAHPPAYFVGLRWWSAVAGCSLTALRVPSAVLMALATLAVYRLAGVFFARIETRLLVAALFAASPVVRVYAQEARPYALLVLVTTVSTVLWLELMRHGSGWSGSAGGSAPRRRRTQLGAALALVTVVGALTHTLYLLVAAAQAVGAVRLWRGGETASDRVRVVFGAVVLAVCVLAAWMTGKLALTGGLTLGAQYTWEAVPSRFLAGRLLLVLTGVVFDPFHPAREGIWLPEGPGTVLDLPAPDLAVVAATGMLLASSMLALLRYAPPLLRTTVLVLAWPTLLFVLKDLLAGGSLAGVPRYQFPTFIAMLLAVGFAVDRITAAPGRRSAAGVVIVVLVLGLQMLSGQRYVAATHWWNTAGEHGPEVFARLTATARNPIVFVSQDPRPVAHVLRLAHHVSPTLGFRRATAREICQAASDSRDVFAAGYTAHELAAEPCLVGRLEPISTTGLLYRIAGGASSTKRPARPSTIAPSGTGS